MAWHCWTPSLVAIVSLNRIYNVVSCSCASCLPKVCQWSAIILHTVTIHDKCIAYPYKVLMEKPRVVCHSWTCWGNQVYNRSVLLRSQPRKGAVNPLATFPSHIFIHGIQYTLVNTKKRLTSGFWLHQRRSQGNPKYRCLQAYEHLLLQCMYTVQRERMKILKLLIHVS